uniref:Uncharacterized protein n=1 Tax=Anguilla anguilla TaxID=7936 RepID=A0A0E9TY29_ANGAN
MTQNKMCGHPELPTARARMPTGKVLVYWAYMRTDVRDSGMT